MNNSACEICEESYNEDTRRPLIIFPCGHTYCSECLNQVPNKLCPQCRRSITQTITNFSVLSQIVGVNKTDPIATDIKKRLDEFELIKESFDIILKKMEFKLKEANAKLKMNTNAESKLIDLKFHVDNEFSFEQEFKDIKKLIRENSMDIETKKEPCENKKVASLIEDAVRADKNKNFKKALKLYESAIRQLLVAAKSPENKNIELQLRKKCSECLERAEVLKSFLSSSSSADSLYI